MGKINLHPDTIDQVKQRVNIYDIVSLSIDLRIQGKDYVGSCPFSKAFFPNSFCKHGCSAYPICFVVSPSKKMFHCFGCNIRGDSIKYLARLYDTSFNDAVLTLAEYYKIPVQLLNSD